MAVGGVIESILSAGTTAGITTEIYDGELPQQVSYPAVMIDDFSDSEACKDGPGPEIYTVTVSVYADTKKLCDAIITAAKTDLVGTAITANGHDISGIKFIGRQPWLKDKETRKWQRPADFEVFVK